MREVIDMPLFTLRKKDSDPRVRSARIQIDEALDRMIKILDEVQEQAQEAKEELGEGRAS